MTSVSVIIPALNESPRIAAAVARAWNLAPAEVIVVDGESSDDTRQLAQSAGAEVITSPRGRARQQNAGARLARGDFLLFFHADTSLDADGLDQLRWAAARGAVAGGFRQSIDAPEKIFRWLEQGNLVRALRNGQLYGDQGIFLQRRLFDPLGGFPEVPLLEDVILMRRLRRVARVVVLPGPLRVSARRWQRQGVVRQTLRNWSILTAHRLGVSPARLAQYYRPQANAATL